MAAEPRARGAPGRPGRALRRGCRRDGGGRRRPRRAAAGGGRGPRRRRRRHRHRRARRGARGAARGPPPLVGGRGCSVDVTGTAPMTRAVMVADAHVALSPIGDRVRIAGTMELSRDVDGRRRGPRPRDGRGRAPRHDRLVGRVAAVAACGRSSPTGCRSSTRSPRASSWRPPTRCWA